MTERTDERSLAGWKSSSRTVARLRRIGAYGRKFQYHLRVALSRAAHFMYRNAPLSIGAKRWMMDFLFSHFPSLFGSTITYRRWRFLKTETNALAGLPSEVAAPRGMRHVRTEIPSVPSPGVFGLVETLSEADGHWEWSDYTTVRERVLRAVQAQRTATLPKAFAMLEYNEKELDRAIATLRFRQSDKPLVSIIVPAYNKLRYTVECLASIMRSAPRIEYEIIVADDASTDCTAKRLSDVPNLVVSTGEQNLHFLRNVNRVLPMARGRFVLLLNNDVQVQSGWLDHLVAAALACPNIGAVGPKIVYPLGHLQEAGCSFRPDGTAEMVGLNEDPDLPQFNYPRDVDYCSGACLLIDATVFRELGGFDEYFAPAYCEDSDLCLRLRSRGLRILYVPKAVVAHHLSKTTADQESSTKLALIGRNLDRFAKRWQATIDKITDVRLIAFYLPQFHPIPENDLWWGKGFTEWRNVSRAKPNFVGHYQPRLPSDLGFYDLRVADVMEQQADLARRYGIGGFCFYYYWFAGRRLLEMPVERLLRTGRPDFPFCLCWANENWTRRWDGQDNEILMAQAHSDVDDVAVILDLIRYLTHPNYIRIDGRPLLLVYRATLFPDFARTASTWRRVCREQGIGEIYLSLVESFEMVFNSIQPAAYGADAMVEFPPQGMADPRSPSGTVINSEFNGQVSDYVDLAVRYCLREQTPYVRFRGLMPGWDNTARRQNNSFCFERATPGAFQAWAEYIIEQTRNMRSGDERLVFVNAWNEWAEGAYLEPDQRFGHTFLEAIKNARDSALLKRGSSYALG